MYAGRTVTDMEEGFSNQIPVYAGRTVTDVEEGFSNQIPAYAGRTVTDVEEGYPNPIYETVSDASPTSADSGVGVNEDEVAREGQP